MGERGGEGGERDCVCGVCQQVADLVKTAAPFSPRWSRAGCCSSSASRKFYRHTSEWSDECGECVNE